MSLSTPQSFVMCESNDRGTVNLPRGLARLDPRISPMMVGCFTPNLSFVDSRTWMVWKGDDSCSSECNCVRIIFNKYYYGVDVKRDPRELAQVYDSLFVQFDHDLNGAVDLEEFKVETKQMLLAMANGMGFLPVQMVLDEDSFLKMAVERETAKADT